jgi:hypothetical protein
MSSPNALEIKEKILSILRRRGPSLPVHVAKETGLSILFASAFLSELIADKKIKYSDMKVGSSPIYFLNEHAYMLERFSQHLQSREKEAFTLLRERKFLIDREQSPMIRVALRAIKDFAIPFNKEGQTIWRYYTVPESEFILEKKLEVKPETKEIIVEIKEEAISVQMPKAKIEENFNRIKVENPIEIKAEKPKEIRKELQKELNISDKREKLKKAKVKKTAGKKIQKGNDSFLNKVKDWISKNSMELMDIESFNKNELQLKIKNKNEEQILVAYNKKKLRESDLIRANKKAREAGLRYIILSQGEPQKKINDLIDAAKNLSDIKKME